MADGDGKFLVVGGVGIGVGAIIANLLKSTPAKAAGNGNGIVIDNDIRTALAALLAQGDKIDDKLADANKNLIAIKNVISEAQVSPLDNAGAAKLHSPDPIAIFDQAIRQATVVGIPLHSDIMVNWRPAWRVCFKIESTLDQPVLIQVICNHVNSFFRTVDVGPIIALVAGDNQSAVPAWDDWHPWVGVAITVAAAPTVGRLTIYSVAQE